MMTIIKYTKKIVPTQIKKVSLLILFVFLFLSCSNERFITETIKTTNGWGYTISNGNKIIIKQCIIPVISETKSFSSENDALKVADLVVKKLSQNISPSVTKNDLILLKIKI